MDVHWLTCLGVRLMSISNSSIIFQNKEESYFVVEVKEKQDSDPIFLEHMGKVHN